MIAQNKDAVLHVRFDGRSFDVPLRDLDVAALSSDFEVKRALSSYLSIAQAQFRDYVVDRHETGNLTVWPEAIFG